MAKSWITVCFTYSLRITIFLYIDISQGSVATRLGCDDVFKYDFVTNFLLSLTVKEFRKSVNIWRSFGQEYSVLFCFESQCTMRSLWKLLLGQFFGARCTHRADGCSCTHASKNDVNAIICLLCGWRKLNTVLLPWRCSQLVITNTITSCKTATIRSAVLSSEDIHLN